MRTTFFMLPSSFKRIISGVFLIPLTVGIILEGPPWTTILMTLIAVGLSYEWVKMANLEKIKKACFFYVIILSSIGIYLVWGIKLSGAFLLSSTTLFYYYARLKKEWPRTLAPWFFWGMLYVGIPSLSFLWIRDSDYGGIILIWVLSIIWASDIGAYFIGTWVGGPKLAPRISPKKTWSGFIGGAFFSVFVGIGGGLWLGSEHLGLLTGIAFAVSVLGVGGDLIESFLKRFWGVKDSGGLIPGHGGLLDRLDSTLLVLPFLAGGMNLVEKIVLNISTY